MDRRKKIMIIMSLFVIIAVIFLSVLYSKNSSVNREDINSGLSNEKGETISNIESNGDANAESNIDKDENGNDEQNDADEKFDRDNKANNSDGVDKADDNERNNSNDNINNANDNENNSEKKENNKEDLNNSIEENDSYASSKDETEKNGTKINGDENDSDQNTIGEDKNHDVTEESSMPVLSVDDVTVKAGDTNVKVCVNIENNPGILGMSFSVHYDENYLSLKSVKNGAAISKKLSLTKANELKSGSNFLWDGQEISGEDIKDGAVLEMNFDVNKKTPSGTYQIVLVYNDGDIVDANLNTVTLDVENGSIVIE